MQAGCWAVVSVMSLELPCAALPSILTAPLSGVRTHAALQPHAPAEQVRLPDRHFAVTEELDQAGKCFWQQEPSH